MTRRGYICGALLAAQTFLVWAAVSTAESVGAAPAPLPLDPAGLAEDLVEEINQARWENGGLPPLKLQSDLQAAAGAHCQDMAVDNYFAHDSYDCVGGSIEFDRTWVARVSDYYSGWSILGEILAAGYPTVEAAVQGWLNSPGHRNILLSTNYTEVGGGHYSYSGPLSCTQNTHYADYWGADFGNRSGVYPAIINREAATTAQRGVSLYIYGQGWASEMRFKNEDGTWSDWEPYNANKTWTLSCGTGSKTVHVQLRNGGQVKETSDTISLVGEGYHLEVETDQLTFLYGMAEKTMAPAPSQEVTVENTGVSCDGVGWEASPAEDWLALSPVSGTTLSTLSITPTGFVSDTQGMYTNTVTITATNPLDAGGSPQSVTVRLIVADRLHQMFLPLVMR